MYNGLITVCVALLFAQLHVNCLLHYFTMSELCCAVRLTGCFDQHESKTKPKTMLTVSSIFKVVVSISMFFSILTMLSRFCFYAHVLRLG